MREKWIRAFTAGFLGAVILIALMYVMEAAALAGPPGFIGIYRHFFGIHSRADHATAALLFAIAGGLWGMLFVILVRRRTPLRGMAFGFVPTLWLWLVVAPAMGKPVFNGFTAPGIFLPILYNVVIWGSFVGWFARQRLALTRSF